METPPPPQPPQNPQPQQPTPQPAPGAAPGQPAGYPHPQGGPSIKFDYIGNAFTMVFGDAATWIVAAIFVIIAMIVVQVITGILFVGMLLSGAVFMAIIVRLLTLVLMVFVVNLIVAQMYKMAKSALLGVKPSVNDMFKFGSDAGNIVVASLLIGLGVGIGMGCLVIPGVIFGGLTMFTMPLIIDRKMPAMQAITTSIDMLKKDLVMASLFWLAASICSGIVFGLTMAVGPIATSMLYRDYFGFSTDPQGNPAQ